jgi:glycosyltransferase involved in cell wall biosynthesis
VVIPALNESRRLPGTLDRLDAFLDPSLNEAGIGQREILVVDDGSTDGTASAVEALGHADVKVLRHSCNRGKGAAVRTGVLATDGDVVIVTDADGNYLSNRAEPFLEAIRSGTDIVLGSRAHAGCEWQVTPAAARYIHRRRVMGRIFHDIVRAITGLNFEDTQTGLKFFRGEVAREVFGDLVIEGFAYDVEVLMRARRRGYRIVELPLVYHCPTSESRVTRVDPPRMFLDLFRVRRVCRGEGRVRGS